MLRKIYYLLTPAMRRVVRRIWFLPVDVYVQIAGRREPLIPPQGLIFTGAGDFKNIGDRLVQSIIGTCKLSPKARVLDIGCGIGRIARPLTGYLDADGCYNGFDVVKTGISWCTNAYKQFPNFHFQYIPLKNDLYNLSTDQEPAAFTFPYKNSCFDLVVLTSVFTHMQEPEVKRYISEIARVLNRGGHCYCSFFIITEATDKFLQNSKDPFFRYRYDTYFLHDDKVKDANIAYRFEAIRDVIASAGLMLQQFLPGWWPGGKREDAVDFQDILIIAKP